MDNTQTASKTIIRQIVAGIACLVVGLAIITLQLAFLETLGVHWFNEEGWIQVIWLFGSMSMAVSIPWLSIEQFWKALAPPGVVKRSVVIFLIVGGFLTAFVAIVAVLEYNLPTTVSIVGFNLLLFVSLGLSTGAIQSSALLIARFDPDLHRRRMNSRVDLEAVESGTLPYRQKVRIFWETVAHTLTAVVVLGVIVLLRKEECAIPRLLVGIGMVGVFLFRAITLLGTLLDPHMKSTQGSVTKSITRGRRKIGFLKLHCRGTIYSTDTSIWNAILSRQEYRLWYLEIETVLRSGSNRRVIAYQMIDPAMLRLPGDVGKHQRNLQQHKTSEESYLQALEAINEIKRVGEKPRGKEGQAAIYHELGIAAQEQHQWARAEQYYQQALEIYAEFNYRYEQAGTYLQLGIVAQEQRQWAQARDYYLQALTMTAEFGDEQGLDVVLRNLAQLWQTSEDADLPAAIASILRIGPQEVEELLRDKLQE